MRGTGRTMHANPYLTLRARLRRVGAVFAAAAFVSGVWAFWPLSWETQGPQTRELPGATPMQATTPLTSLDLEPFSATLWVEPKMAIAELTKTGPKPQALPDAPAVTLQLLGIERLVVPGNALDDLNRPQWRAVLYDPDTDRLFMVSDGERVGVYDVASVESNRLVLRVAASQFAPRDDVLAIDLPEGDAGTAGAGARRSPRGSTRKEVTP